MIDHERERERALTVPLFQLGGPGGVTIEPSEPL